MGTWLDLCSLFDTFDFLYENYARSKSCSFNDMRIEAVKFTTLDMAKYKNATIGRFFNHFIISYIVAPKYFAISNLWINCHNNIIGDWRSTLGWPCGKVKLGLNPDPSYVVFILLKVNNSY